MTTPTAESPRAVQSDSELVERIDVLVREEKHLEAARLIRKIRDLSLVTDSHRKLLDTAGIIERAVGDLLSSPRDECEWIKQGESHGRYDFTIYYKIGDGAELKCRIESPVPSDLLVPLLSVLNESGLYQTWIPSWQTPFRLGVQESQQLLLHEYEHDHEHDRRGHQVIQVSVAVPWPMKPREALFSVQAVDDIDENGFIVATMTTLNDKTEDGRAVIESLPTGFEVPPPASGMERCDFDGAVLFRNCPEHHPNYAASKSKFPHRDLILLQFTMQFDAKMAMVPKSTINFVTRTALGVVWNMLLRVAEDVRDGNREEHRRVISEKADFYRWVEERCEYMLHAISSGGGGVSDGDGTAANVTPNRGNELQHKQRQQQQQQQDDRKEEHSGQTNDRKEVARPWTL
eukprot:CAMPEP_0172391140 /NCGR_PEP_ID=MMETSP1061-20121228/7607_1 /TAXON_ID=37318 /ORGANISM="Pseudo-nitzschia pungens, Strain cf. pungens" /LENGTH=402 /DNA_ID=CAMNT_0013121679 /DNA_START=230 /DNA_END=1435 /DNA_ORIENTATION=+